MPSPRTSGLARDRRACVKFRCMLVYGCAEFLFAIAALPARDRMRNGQAGTSRSACPGLQGWARTRRARREEAGVARAALLVKETAASSSPNLSSRACWPCLHLGGDRRAKPGCTFTLASSLKAVLVWILDALAADAVADRLWRGRRRAENSNARKPALPARRAAHTVCVEIFDRYPPVSRSSAESRLRCWKDGQIPFWSLVWMTCRESARASLRLPFMRPRLRAIRFKRLLPAACCMIPFHHLRAHSRAYLPEVTYSRPALARPIDLRRWRLPWLLVIMAGPGVFKLPADRPRLERVAAKSTHFLWCAGAGGIMHSYSLSSPMGTAGADRAGAWRGPIVAGAGAFVDK